MATNLAAPTLQTPGERPISFLVDDTVSGAGPLAALTLYVRPEDLTRNDPSRVNITQTLGGAWGDSFGRGVPTITIAGHTGWRRDTSGDDGMARFDLLKDQVFKQWHERRSLAVAAGQDPSGVQLIFSDALDNFASVVAPLSFTLKRSRSRSLLFQYQLTMAVLEDEVGSPLSALQTVSNSDVLRQLGLDSLADALGKIKTYAADIQNFVDRNIAGPVRAFMNATQTVFARVQSAINSVESVAGSLINVAQMMARSGANIFHTLAAVASLPARIKGRLMQVATAYLNIFCVLKNSLKSRATYEDYTDLYGASNCSSTSGGRPISQLGSENTFTYVVPAPVAPVVSVSSAAQSGLSTLANTDVALSPLSSSTIGQLASDVSSGVVLA